MRVLVTGGSGFIGSHLVRHLIAQGHEVLNIDCLTYAASPASLASVQGHPAYHFEQINICDDQPLRAAIRDFAPRWVFHLAAESHVDRSIDSPLEFIQTNVTGTGILLQACREMHARLTGNDHGTFRFIHVSTDEVFGSIETGGSFTETSPYSPRSPYSASKAASDHLVRAWHETYGLPVILTNCCNNHGPFQFPEKLIPIVIISALSGQPIPVYGSGRQVRDWIHVDDHCRALLTIADQGKVGDTYLIGAHNEWTNLDLIEFFCDELDRRLPRDNGAPHRQLISHVEDRPGHDQRYAINANKLRTALCWEPLKSPKAAFLETLDWYLKNQDWWKPLLPSGQPLSRQGLLHDPN